MSDDAAGQLRDLVPGWLGQSLDSRVDSRLRELHTLVADEIRQRRPVCLASGRCCSFADHGHDLMVTGLEAAWCWRTLASAPTTAAVVSGQTAGVCALLRDGLCSAGAARPVACRVYFCDRSAADWMNQLAEDCHQQIRRLHEEVSAEYRYARWIDLLRAFSTGAAITTGS